MTAVVTQAIEEKRLLKIKYDGATRVIEPHAYGINKQGNELLRAFQISGASTSKESTGWKLFRLDRVSSIVILCQTFDGPRPEYRQGDVAINKRILAELPQRM